MACDRVVSDLLLPLWEEVLWPFSGCLGQCASTHNTTSTQWNVPRRYGPYGELFFFLLEKEPMVRQGAGSVWGPASRRMASFSSF